MIATTLGRFLQAEDRRSVMVTRPRSRARRSVAFTVDFDTPASAAMCSWGACRKLFPAVGELCENAARPIFWLHVWVFRRSKPYLWLRRGGFGRTQSARKPSVEKLCDRPAHSALWRRRPGGADGRVQAA